MPTRLLYESHCHTPLCKHAHGEPVEYAAEALARGLKGIIITCHCPLPEAANAALALDAAAGIVHVVLASSGS